MSNYKWKEVRLYDGFWKIINNKDAQGKCLLRKEIKTKPIAYPVKLVTSSQIIDDLAVKLPIKNNNVLCSSAQLPISDSNALFKAYMTMKNYKTIFIITPGDNKGTVKFSAFDHPLVGEIMIQGNSTLLFDTRKMLGSDLVVTVGYWHEDENCNKVVQVARIMGKTIIHETHFRNYVEQNYN